MTRIKKTIYYLLYILMGFQIAMGLIWMGINVNAALVLKLLAVILFILIIFYLTGRIKKKTVKINKTHMFTLAFALTYPPVLLLLISPLRAVLSIDLFTLSVPANLAKRVLYQNENMGVTVEAAQKIGVIFSDAKTALFSRDRIGPYFYQHLGGSDTLALIKEAFMSNKKNTVLGILYDVQYTLLFPFYVMLKPSQRIENPFVWEYWEFIKEAPSFSAYFFQTSVRTSFVVLVITLSNAIFSVRKTIFKNRIKIILWACAVIIVALLWLAFKCAGVMTADIAPFVCAWVFVMARLRYGFILNNKGTI